MIKASFWRSTFVSLQHASVASAASVADFKLNKVYPIKCEGKLQAKIVRSTHLQKIRHDLSNGLIRRAECVQQVPLLTGPNYYHCLSVTEYDLTVSLETAKARKLPCNIMAYFFDCENHVCAPARTINPEQVLLVRPLFCPSHLLF